MTDLNNLPIASPMSFRFLGGYLRIGMPLAFWLQWRTWRVQAGGIDTFCVCAGPFFAWARVRRSAQ